GGDNSGPESATGGGGVWRFGASIGTRGPVAISFGCGRLLAVTGTGGASGGGGVCFAGGTGLKRFAGATVLTTGGTPTGGPASGGSPVWPVGVGSDFLPP